MEKWFSGFGRGVRDNVGATLVIAVGLGLWTATKVYAEQTPLGLPFALSMGAVVGMCVVVSWGHLAQMHERAKRTRRRTPADAERQIREWLYRYGFSVTQKPHPALEFGLELNDPGAPLPITIIQVKGEAWLMVSARMNMDDPTKALVAAQAPLYRFDVATQLAQLEVEYQMIPAEHPTPDVLIHEKLVFDETVDDLRFLNVVRRVRTGAVLVGVLTQRAIVANPPPQLPAVIP